MSGDPRRATLLLCSGLAVVTQCLEHGGSALWLQLQGDLEPVDTCATWGLNKDVGTKADAKLSASPALDQSRQKRPHSWRLVCRTLGQVRVAAGREREGQGH